jgi:hypothetical protein
MTVLRKSENFSDLEQIDGSLPARADEPMHGGSVGFSRPLEVYTAAASFFLRSKMDSGDENASMAG